MRWIESRAFIACQLLAGASGLVTSGCLGELWPEDDVSGPRSAACTSTNRAPALDTSAGERIAIDATDSNVSVIDVDAHGNGADFIGALRLVEGVGTLEIGCEALPIAVYGSFVASATLQFRAVAVKTDRLYTLQFECEQDRLRFIWLESTDGAEHAPEELTGDCSKATFLAASDVVFPAVDMPFPPTLAGYTIDGPYISLTRDGKGSFQLDGLPHELFVLADGGCREDCDLGEWRTLDTLAWDRSGRRLTFGFLDLRQQGLVTFFSQVTLPGLVERIGAWTTPATFTMP